MEKSETAFLWIINLLQKYQIPFVITGGLAAKSYGSPRLLNDIDIDIPDDKFPSIIEELKLYIIFGPERYKDERWDVMLMTLNYYGQEIDISGGDTLKICDARTGRWADCPTDFKNATLNKIFGTAVPVIQRSDLINYKNMLVGEHQKIDIRAISGQ